MKDRPLSTPQHERQQTRERNRSLTQSTDDAASLPDLAITDTTHTPPSPPAAPDVTLDTLTHEHARPCRRLKHIVYALAAQRAALLVSPCTDLSSDLVRLRGLHEVMGERRVERGTQIGFTANEQDGNCWTADGANFLDPLWSSE